MDDVITFFFIFFIVWWIVIFAVLPFGVRPPDEPGEGHADSAPEKPHLLRKMLATTVIAAFITAGIMYGLEVGWLDWRE